MKIVFPVDNDRTLNLIFKIFSDKGFECGINRTCLDNWLSADKIIGEPRPCHSLTSVCIFSTLLSGHFLGF